MPSPGGLPNPGIRPRSPALQANSLQSEPPGKHIFWDRISKKRFQTSLKFRVFLWDMVENCGRLLNTIYSWKLCVDTYISTPLLATALSKLVHASQCFTQFFEQASNWSPCFRFAHWNLYTEGEVILFKFKSHNVTPLLTTLQDSHQSPRTLQICSWPPSTSHSSSHSPLHLLQPPPCLSDMPSHAHLRAFAPAVPLPDTHMAGSLWSLHGCHLPREV